MAAAVDNQRRIRKDDIRFGVICPTCAGPKAWQARECWGCRTDHSRTSSYWQRRTCPDCGGHKSHKSGHCLRCEHERQRRG